MAFDKTWFVLIAGCGVLSLAFWNGMNAITLKMTLLWMFISFGFLTLIMHLFGSPISILLHKLFKSADPTPQGIILLRVKSWMSVCVITLLLRKSWQKNCLY